MKKPTQEKFKGSVSSFVDDIEISRLCFSKQYL